MRETKKRNSNNLKLGLRPTAKAKSARKDSTMNTNNTFDKSLFTYDHLKHTIVGSQRSFKQAGIPGSAAYEALMEVQAGQPTYTLSPIPPKNKVAKKQTYRGLTFDLINEYVETFGNDAQKAELSQMVNDNEAYPAIKSWFLDYFRVGFTVEKAKREIAYKKLRAKKSKVYKAVRANVVKAAPAAEGPKAVNF